MESAHFTVYLKSVNSVYCTFIRHYLIYVRYSTPLLIIDKLVGRTCKKPRILESYSQSYT